MSNEAVHSGCTDQTQTTARLVIVLERSRTQKISTGDNTFAKWKGTFRSKSHLESSSRIFQSDQTEMVRSICRTNRNFRNFGLNGKRQGLYLQRFKFTANVNLYHVTKFSRLYLSFTVYYFHMKNKKSISSFFP